MHYTPHVTVAVCVKNAETSIKKAIESILNQDYPAEFMDLIVVDGHSKDKTIPIIKKAVSKGNIKTKIFYENKGLGHARQIAVENASGDYTVWVDGDIVLSRNYVRKHVEFMEQNPAIGIAAGRFSIRTKANLIGTLESIDWVIGDHQKRQTLTSDPRRICCAGSIYRAKAIKQIGGFDGQIEGAGEDIDLGYRINKAGWSLYFGINASLQHIGKETWKSIWDENFWYGYGSHYIFHKHKVSVPTSSLEEALQRTLAAYRLTRRKSVFLLPILYLFKKAAWLHGFTKAHMDSYGHI